MNLNTRLNKLEGTISTPTYCSCMKESNGGKVLPRFILPFGGAEKHGTVTQQPCCTCGGLWETEYRDIMREDYDAA